MQAEVGGEEEAEGGGNKGEVGMVDLAAGAEIPGEREAEAEKECGESEGKSEQSEGIGVQVEKVAEAEGVFAGVLLEELGEVGVLRWCAGVDDEEQAGCGRCKAK